MLKRNKPLRAKTPMRRVSKKKQEYRQSKEGRAGYAYMGKVKQLPCCICGAHPPSEAHHCRSDGMPRNDMHTIPLCIPCHTGPQGYHKAKRTWHERNGKDYDYIEATREAVKALQR